MKRIFSCFIFHLLCVQLISSQTFFGTGGAIPDDGTAMFNSIEVTGLPDMIDSISFGLEMVCINLTHTWNSDLEIRLIAPDGTNILLSANNGWDLDNYTNTCFVDSAETFITLGYPPYTGFFKPQGQMGLINNFQNPNGIWYLYIYDTYPFADTGELLDWNISFGDEPASAFSLNESSLPIIKINTSGQTILNDPKIEGHMEIIDNGLGEINHITDLPNNYNGNIAIELRGSSSLGFPQKSFDLETQDEEGKNLDVSLLDMPEENDWILYAPYNDKSLMRNTLTYYLAEELGAYATRSKFCEVVLNGEYIGVYVLMEQIKRDSNRVDIADLNVSDIEGDELSGGYIIKIDWVGSDGWYSNFLPDQTSFWNNNIYFQYVDPKDDSIQPEQKIYIQNYIDSFETALDGANFMDTVLGWRKYASENSFIDYFILNEISKNVDGYRLSTFLYKDKNKKLRIGPVWDYNLAWHNADYCAADWQTGWAYAITDYCATDLPFWWRKLITDTLFNNNLRCRWDELRDSVLSNEFLFHYMDSIESYVQIAQERHFQIWPILGVYVWPNPWPYANTFEEELLNMKTWIGGRMTWLDESIPGVCYKDDEDTVIIENISNFSKLQIEVYPNPVSEVLQIKWKNASKNLIIEMFNMNGESIYNTVVIKSEAKLNIDLSFFSTGIYQLVVSDENGFNLNKIKIVKN